MRSIYLGKIKLIMKYEGFTQGSLAKRLGISRISLNRFLVGSSDMNSEKVIKLLEVLDILQFERLIDIRLNALSFDPPKGSLHETVPNV